MKINENQRKSTKIKENQWKSNKINGNQGKSMKINENQWKSMKIIVNQRKSTKIKENQWKWMKIKETIRNSGIEDKMKFSKPKKSYKFTHSFKSFYLKNLRIFFKIYCLDFARVLCRTLYSKTNSKLSPAIVTTQQSLSNSNQQSGVRAKNASLKPVMSEVKP